MTIPVGILGATGLVGQRLVARLEAHPEFALAAVAASDARIGERYGDAVSWRIDEPLPETAKELTLDRADPDDLTGSPPIVLSALPGGVAQELEPAFAEAGYLVCSNASPRRMDPDVPLLIPEVNAEHIDLLSQQRERRGWAGGILKNPNCTAITVTLPLAALRPWSPEAATIVTMQALSGAGATGVAAVDAVDNLLPHIPGEADKLADEPRKLLGEITQGNLNLHSIDIDAACHRVPVQDGHFASLWVDLGEPATTADIVEAFQTFRGSDLPSSPKSPIVYASGNRRPQPRLDRSNEDGMATTVGSVESIESGVRFDCLAHNTVRGAAGACLLVAELAVERGLVS